MNYLTKATFHKLRKRQTEFRARLQEVRQVVRNAIETGGGTHDNAMYDSSLQDQWTLSERLQKIESALVAPSFIDDLPSVPGRVTLGTRLTLKNLDTGKVEEFQVLGPADVEFGSFSNAISVNAPLAQQLIGKSQGERLRVSVGAGDYDAEILEVQPYSSGITGE